MPEVAKAQSGIVILKVKTEILIQMKTGHGHFVKGKFRSFEPLKLVVQSWRGTDEIAKLAHVTAFDITLHQPGNKRFPDSVRFGLVGCPQYQYVPEWIARVIREFGYQDPIERMV